MGGSIQLLQTLKELEKEEYKERYQIIKRQREIAKSEETPSIEKYRLKLNRSKSRSRLKRWFFRLSPIF